MKVWGEVTRDGMIAPYIRWRGELVEEYRPGDRLVISVDKDRNGKFSSLFHLMLGLIVKAINRGPAQTTIDDMKRWVKLKRGWYAVVALPHPQDGITHAIMLKSTAFASMGEGEFQQFARETCELIRDELAPWISNAPEWGEALTIINQIAPGEAA